MSNTVDERVVEMRFDNKQFESGVSTTLSTLDRLKKALKFDGASQGLEDISNAARRCDMSGLSGAVDTVKARFSALEVVAMTTLANITNTAINTGKRIVSALTIEPVTSGLQEYETQINAVQTILANTSSTQAEVSQQAIQEVNAMAEQSAAAAVQANERAMDSMRKTHSSQLKSLSKQAAAESKALQKSQAEQLKTFEKQAAAELETMEASHSAQLEEYEKRASEELSVLKQSHEEQLEEFNDQADAEIDSLKKSHKQQLKEFKDNAENELDILEKNYDDQLDVLKDSIDEETKLLRKSHEEKLDLYHEEYMEKLKATDEDRYREIKAVEDEIDAINNLTKAEDEEKKAAEQQKKLAELKNDVYSAETYEELIEAQERLSEYEEELSREQVLKEREKRIQELKEQKDAINERYDLINEQIEAEYNEIKEQENELYETQSETLKKEQEQKKKDLKDTYDYEKDLIKDRQEAERDALDEQQEAEMDALRDRQEAERDALNEKLEAEMSALNERQETEREEIEQKQNSERKALTERQSAEREALTERQSAERDALSERQEAAREALSERQEAEMEALSAQHETTLKNIEDEKNARIKALSSVQKETKKASTLEDVNKALDELNEYADKTIYNFTEMTRNIGTFTAAGVDLETSVGAIKGIANLAAMSGSTSQQASTAMYQLSQALATGKVQLMDWNSVVNAGMGGQIFRDSLMETARVHGIAIDEMVASEGSFRDALQNGWLTSDILLETLQKFTGDLTEEELRAIGYTEDQIESIMQLGQTAQDAATKIKTFSQLWDTLKETAQSGWTNTWEIVIGDFEEAKELWTGVYDVLGGLIDQQSDARNAILQGWKDMGGRTVLIEAIKNAFEGVTQVVKIFKSVLETVFPPMTSEKLYAMTEGLRNLTSHFKLNNQNALNLARTFKGLFSAVDIVASLIKGGLKAGLKLLSGLLGGLDINVLDVTASIGDAVSSFRDWIKENDIISDGLDKLTDGILLLISKVKDFVKSILPIDINFTVFDSIQSKIKDIGIAISNSNILDLLSSIWKLIKKIGSGFVSSLENLAGTFGESLANADFNDFLNFIGTLSASGLAVAISGFVKNLTKPLKESEGFLKKITGILDGVRDCFEAYQTQLKAGVLKSIAIAIGILAASIFVISTIDPDKLGDSLGAITVMFADLVGAVTILTKIGGTIKQTGKIISTMLGMSISVLILASALKKISGLSLKELVTGLVGIGAMLAMLIIAVDKIGDGTKKLKKGSTGLILMAAAIKILASACKDLSGLSWEELGKGLSGVGGLLLELGTFVNFAGKADHIKSTGFALIEIAAALKILASALSDFGSMSWGEIAKGLVAMGGGLLEIAAAINFMPKNIIGIGTGMVIVGAALNVIANAIGDFGGYSWEEIAKGLIAMGGALAELVVGLNLMSGTLAGSAAMLIAAGALAVLAPTLSSLGSMSWEEIAKGLAAIAGSFVVIGVAGTVLSPLVPTILGLSAALLLIGAGVAAAGIGLTSLAVAFTSLAGAGVAGASAVTSSLTIIVTGIASLIPFILTKIGEGIVAFCETIANSASSIGEAVKTVILSLVDVMTECIPAIVDGAMQLIVDILSSLVEYTPQIVDLLMEFLTALFDKVAEHLPDLVNSGVNLIMTFFSSVVEALKGIDMETLVQGIIGVGLVSGVMTALSAIVPIIPGAMAGVLGVGGVITELGLVLAAIGALGQIPGFQWLIDEGGEVLEGIGTAIGKFIGGIVGGVMNGVAAQFPQIGTYLSDFITNAKPFIEGVSSIDSSMLEGVEAVVGAIALLCAADILNAIGRFFRFINGGSSLETFAKELVPFGIALSNYSNIVKNVDSDVVENTANAAGALVELENALGNEGGIISWFTGDNTLDDFADKLVPFGVALSNYSNVVKNVDSDAVSKSAEAAKSLAELENSLDNAGGFVSVLTGDNSLADFAAKIFPFGVALSNYSNAVKGVDADAVKNSAEAAKGLAELESSLDNEGGVISWFTGDNTLDNFGANLKSFGEGLANLAGSVDNSAVTMIESIIAVSKEILAMGDDLDGSAYATDLSNFASNLSNFGNNFAMFYANISPTDTTTLSNVLAQVDHLIEMAKSMEDIDSSAMGSFGDNLTVIGQNGINSFISEFDNCIERVKTAIDNVLDAMVEQAETHEKTIEDTFGSLVDTGASAISDSVSEFKTLGSDVVTAFIKSAEDISNRDTKTTFEQMVDEAIEALSGMDVSYRFSDAGSAAVNYFLNSARDSYNQNAWFIFSNMVQVGISALEGSRNSFYNAGTYIADGFLRGIESMINNVAIVSHNMAVAALNSATAVLGIHSPSTEFEALGEYSDEGFINGLKNLVGKVKTTGGNVGLAALNAMKDAVADISDIVGDEIDTSPTIRPILDLSDVQNGANQIYGMMNHNGYLLSGSLRIADDTMQNLNRNRPNDDRMTLAVDELKKAIDTIANAPSQAFENVFNITGSNAEEISDIVVSKIQRMIERRSAHMG